MNPINPFKRQLALETWMFVVLCLLFVIVTVSGITSYNKLTSLRDDLKKEEAPDNKIALMKQISARLYEMESNVRTFYFTRDSSYIRTYDESKQNVDKELLALSTFVQSKDMLQPRFDSIKYFVNARYAIFGSWFELEKNIKVTNELNKLPEKLKSDEKKKNDELEDTSLRKKKKKKGEEKNEFNYALLENEVKKIQRTQTNQLNEIGQQELLINMRNKAVTTAYSDLINQAEKEDELKKAANNSKAINKANATNIIIAIFCISCVALLVLIGFTLSRYIIKTRQYHQALGNARMEAENLAVAKQNFLANMTHEIRTPINSIIGFTEQLDKSELEENQREQLQIIKKSSLHLLKVVNDVLDYSKLQAGKFSIERIVFNPADTIQEVIDILLPEVENKNIKMYFDKKQDLPSFLSGDPFRLQQVLLNIIGNAIKFTGSGSIYIAIASEKSGENQCLLKIEVKDTGIGIPANKVNKVFDDFEQAESSISRRFKGTGLGLSISKKLVENQNGSIHITSKEGEGTHVNIILPYEIVNNNYSTDESPKEFDSELLKDKQILVVDDEPFNRKLLRTILSQWGGKIEEAHDGENAIYMAEHRNYDIILMDIRMPGLTGLEVTKKIRKNDDPQKQRVPIIALTASNDAEKEKKCLEIGMNAFLSKPFTEAKLFDVINKTIKEPVSHSKTQNTIEKSIEELNKLGNNDPAFTNEMLELFIKGAREGVEFIKTAYETENWKQVQETAHRIAPSCRHLGALKMLEIVKTLEAKASDSPKKADISILVQDLETESVSTINEVKKYLL